LRAYQFRSERAVRSVLLLAPIELVPLLLVSLEAVLPLGLALLLDDGVLVPAAAVSELLGLVLAPLLEPGVVLLELGLVLDPPMLVEPLVPLVPGPAPAAVVFDEPELEPEPEVLPPLPEVCAMDTPPMTSAAAAARVVRVFLCLVISVAP
jgi:hypothetical protein